MIKRSFNPTRVQVGVVLALGLSAAIVAYSYEAPPEAISKEAKPADAAAPDARHAADGPPKQLFVGKVVMLPEALERLKIKAYDEEIKDQVVLETESGELIPIVPDWRGRAFYQDKELRDRKVELVGFRRQGIPYLQVVSVFTFDGKGQRQYTDYWCDICSIPMYEIKPCDCCQAPIRLRFQPQDLPAYLRPKPASASPPTHDGGKTE